MFLDQVSVTVHAGGGGDGASTFRREAHVPRGGPDGGDGGRGGSVYLRVDPGETMLVDYRFKHHFRADSGGRGEGSKRHGKAGKDLDLAVPPGTVVTDQATGDLIADLVAHGQRVMVARGGRGGLGNVHFATATHRTPKHAQKGEPGEERRLRLELRLIADVGLVGLPNAGKSTLLGALTAATPQVAAYPFTTLEPNLGVIDFATIDPGDERRATIADMPGLIEGASAGAGLGHAFLRHVARTRLLTHVVDLAAGDPERDYQTIRQELEAHDPALIGKVTLVVANKLDLPEAKANLRAFKARRRREGAEVVAVSAMEGEGLDGLIDALRRLLPDAATLAAPGEPAGVVVHRLESAGDAFSVQREADAFRVSGRRIERIAAQTDFENEESANRFQRDLARLGVERELVRAGVGAGDMVRIGSVELEWDDESWGGRA
jgi:GTP-binding protein